MTFDLPAPAMASATPLQQPPTFSFFASSGMGRPLEPAAAAAGSAPGSLYSAGMAAPPPHGQQAALPPNPNPAPAPAAGSAPAVPGSPFAALASLGTLSSNPNPGSEDAPAAGALLGARSGDPRAARPGNAFGAIGAPAPRAAARPDAGTQIGSAGSGVLGAAAAADVLAAGGAPFGAASAGGDAGCALAAWAAAQQAAAPAGDAGLAQGLASEQAAAREARSGASNPTLAGSAPGPGDAGAITPLRQEVRWLQQRLGALRYSQMIHTRAEIPFLLNIGAQGMVQRSCFHARVPARWPKCAHGLLSLEQQAHLVGAMG